MDAKYRRKSGQIPAFGDWENANEMPITQYFDCARQAGLARCSCSGECGADLYAVAFHKTLPSRVYALPQRKRKPSKQFNKAENSINPQSAARNHNPKQRTKSGKSIVSTKSSITVKPIDEDLYKIPPELVKVSKRKKMLRFFSRCMS